MEGGCGLLETVTDGRAELVGCYDLITGVKEHGPVRAIIPNTTQQLFSPLIEQEIVHNWKTRQLQSKRYTTKKYTISYCTTTMIMKTQVPFKFGWIKSIVR